MLNSALRRLAAAHHGRALDALEVHASDDPVALSGRGEAARVLLIGSGVTSGWGVHTHGLALVGSLQRELQVRLGRPVDVEQVSALGAPLASAITLLGERASEDWDAIVVAFGLSDAMSLTPVKEWTQGLGHLMAKLDDAMLRGLLIPIVVAGVPPTNALGALRLLMPLRVLISRHAERLNAASRSLVVRNRRASFVALTGLANSAERPTGSPEAYRVWASGISDALHALMPAETARVDTTTINPGEQRDLAGAVLAPRNADVRAALREVVEQVADHYTADLVLLNLIRGDELWVVARSSGEAVESLTRVGTLADETLRVGVLHVQDVAAHPRFASREGVLRRGVASYAGRVVRDARGDVVGSFSVINGSTSGPIDARVLVRFGAAIEAQLVLLDRVDPDPDPDDAPGRLLPAMTAAERTSDLGEDDRCATTSRRHGDSGRAILYEGDRRRLRGPISRHRHLSREGRLLTEVAAARSAPAETDLWVPGADPVRVLVIGGEYSVGFGAATRSEALDGALARLLHTRTGRGVLVENRSQHGVRLHQLAASLGPAGATTFDLVVWTPTFIEGARLLFRSRWFTGIEMMLRRIEATSNASVVLVGYPSLLGSQPLAVLGRTRAAQINRLLRRLVARHARVMVAEPPAITLKHVESTDGPLVYREAAVQIFATVMDLIDSRGTDSGSIDVMTDRSSSRAQDLVGA